MLKQKLILIGMILVSFLFSRPAFAQKFLERQGRWTIGGGLGITEDPNLYGLAANVNYYITDEISVAPLLQFEFKDENHIFGVAGMVKYNAILSGSNVVRPYGQVGIGFAQFKHEDLFDGDQKTTFLFPVGGGMEFKLNENLSLDGSLLVNLSEEIFVGIFVGVNYLF